MRIYLEDFNYREEDSNSNDSTDDTTNTDQQDA